jgi:hypothetical protein
MLYRTTCLASACLLLLLLWLAVMGTLHRMPPVQNTVLTDVARTTAPTTIPSSLASREGWYPEKFFESRELVSAAEAIARHDIVALSESVDTGLDVNQQGSFGMTLLHWAFVNENVEAFRALLEAGASPNKRLTSTIKLRTSGRHLLNGDCILFTSLRSSSPNKFKFFFAAFSHSKEDDPRDLRGRTLLFSFMNVYTVSNVSPDTLARILDSKIDLDVQDDRGCTAAMLAISLDRADLCLQILKAGGDSRIANKEGDTVETILARKIQHSATDARFNPEQVSQLSEYLASQLRAMDKRGAAKK